LALLKETAEAKMVALLLLLALPVLVLALLDIVALRWGVDSTDGPYSPEWDRRQRWYSYGPTD
jgi:hypothetical protein